jgi:hypothetical protein
MAANAVTFRSALERIGLNAATRTAFNENGFNEILDLITVQEDDLDRLPKHLESWRDAAAPPENQVRVPFVSLQKLKAMRYWVLSQQCMGVEVPLAQDFTNPVCAETLVRMKSDSDQKAATEDTEVRKPPKLTELSKWTKWWELFTTYLGRVRGAALVPLTYLVREHDEVTAEIRTRDYATAEDRRLATTALSGAHFMLDNRTLYDEFKPLVVDGPGWSFVKKFDKAKDGRKAVMALKTQAEGTSAKLTRKQAAYAKLASGSYLGPRKGFDFASYVALHQDAHNELLDLDEPVAEAKKVTDFLKGIRDPGLSTGKQIVLGDPNKLDNFEECQQYLSSLVATTANQAKAERHVASVSTRADSGGSSLVDKIKGGTYTNEQFHALSTEEKARVQQYRDEATKKRKDKRKAQKKKRKLAKARSEREGGSDDDGESGSAGQQPNSNAGAQFGANGNRGKKNRS